MNPITSLKATLYIYCIFTMICHIDYRVSVLILLLLSSLYFTENYTKYKINNEKMNQKSFDLIVSIRHKILESIGFLLISSFSLKPRHS